MANPTTNFGWVMPTSADLVTDLPADFAVFGQGVDTSMAELKGGTTGQVLSKTSNTDMDFTWIANDVGDITGVTAGTGISGGGTSGTVTVTNSMATAITTAGDLIKGTGSGTFARLGIGSTGNVLTVSGGAPVWSAPAGGGKVLQVVQGTYASTYVGSSSSTFITTGLTASITPSASTSKILVLVNATGLGKSATDANNRLGLKLYRGASSIMTFGDTLMYTNAATTVGITASTSYLDSPATTSATTYTLYMANVGGTSAVYFNDFTTNQVTSTIILMEIGA